MVVIISDRKEQEISIVCDRIYEYGEYPIVVGFKEFISDFDLSRSMSSEDELYEFRSPKTRALKNFKGIWYRRNTNVKLEAKDSSKNESQFNKSIENLFQEEQNAIKRILWNSYDQINFLSLYETYNIDKYYVLKMAKFVGLKIPYTLITNNKKDILKALKTYGPLIVKAANENLRLIKDGVFYMQYTEEMTFQKVDVFPDIFFPTLFQQKISKDFEIRVFYLDGRCYSSAILADNNLDYRSSNNTRIVPCKLPDHIEIKISNLMNKLGYNIGGIDILKCKSEYYFLEVNPSGYFGKNSFCCNYNLEDKIAQFLVYGRVRKG